MTAQREALVETVRRVLTTGAYTMSADEAAYESQARTVLALPEIAAALDLADQMRDAEVAEWRTTWPDDRGVIWYASEAAARAAGMRVQRRTVTTLRGPWEDVASQVDGAHV
jgi:quinolinate synthase